MSIVSSSYTVDATAQIDGRKYVTESHTDSEGIVHRVEYLASVGADYQSLMEARVAAIEQSLADQEFSEVTGG